MSKMGNEAIRDADSRSLDNADEVTRLRVEVSNRDQVIGNLMARNRRLRMANAQMMGTLEGLEKGLRDGGLLTHEHIRRIVEEFSASQTGQP
jgi:hypothetical protein